MPRHITIVPILFAIITFGLIGFALLVGAWVTEERTHSRVYWFRTSSAGELEAYLTHSIDDRFGGFRVEQFPVGVVEIESKDTLYAPPSRSGRNRAGIVRTYYSETFTIRIRDGEGERANGGIWDFPPLDEREADVIMPGSIAHEVMKDQSEEMQAMMRDILDGIPDPGEEIEASRRDALAGAVQRALRQDGYGWVADGVDHDRWSRAGFDIVGILKLAAGAVALYMFAMLFERLFSKRKKT